MPTGISVIIPVLNEARVIGSTLATLNRLTGIKEILVVDGGSADETRAIAARMAVVIDSPRGRAQQMNAGARQADGEILLFLHADTLITQAGLDQLDLACRRPGVIGGGFRLSFDDPAWIFKLIALGSNLRARWHRIFFGDQAIFVRREVFRAVNGYPEMPIMEDWALSQRLKNRGKLVLLPAKVITSSRRWHQHGIWKTIFLMHKLKLLYLLGKSPNQLKQKYPD